MTVTRGAAFRRRPLGPTPRPEDGFTLLELMLVVLVIGVLITIALPSFLTARRTVQDRAAQADLRHALEAANTAYVDIQTYATFSAGTLSAVETAIKFADSTANGLGTVGVATGTCDSAGGAVPCLSLAESASDGTCWFVVQSDDGAPLYGKGSASGGVCDATKPQNLAALEFPV